jgi:hypothetical protein
LKVVPVQQEQDVYAQFLVTLTDISITYQNGSKSSLGTSSDFHNQFLLDSGSTFLYLPSDVVGGLTSGLSAYSTEQGHFVDCNNRFSQSNAFLSFTFGGGSGSTTIDVPLSELIYSTKDAYGFPFSSVCQLGVATIGISLLGQSNPYVLGDAFLRSAYIVYDLTHNEIGLAQANFGSTTSNVVELKAADSGIPALTGVSSGVTQIPTSLFSKAAPTISSTLTNGWYTSTYNTGLPTAAATGAETTRPTGAKSEAVGTFAAFNVPVMAVLTASGLFAALGGLVIIL